MVREYCTPFYYYCIYCSTSTSFTGSFGCLETYLAAPVIWFVCSASVFTQAVSKSLPVMMATHYIYHRYLCIYTVYNHGIMTTNCTCTHAFILHASLDTGTPHILGTCTHMHMLILNAHANAQCTQSSSMHMLILNAHANAQCTCARPSTPCKARCHALFWH